MDINALYAEYCDKVWAAFVASDNPHRNHKSCAFRMWCQRSPVARQAIIDHLAKHGAPTDKKPFFWIQDFPEPQPTNLNGCRRLPDEPLVRAIYHGFGGLYTAKEAQLFGMQILGEFVL